MIKLSVKTVSKTKRSSQDRAGKNKSVSGERLKEILLFLDNLPLRGDEQRFKRRISPGTFRIR